MALGDNPDVHWPVADIPDVELPEGYNWCELGAVTKDLQAEELRGVELQDRLDSLLSDLKFKLQVCF